MTPPVDRTDLVLSGRYRLEERIGTGGAGAVWRALDTVLGRAVAVKLLHEDLEQDASTRERFRREATAAAAIHHPHAAVIYDIGHDDGRDYLVMELVDGPSLAVLLDGEPLAPDLVAALGHQVAAALGAAHQRGLTHRDVKPGNILLSRDGAAKVVDFGIAKALGETTQELTAVGTIVGTAAYLAPEQLEAGAPVDGRADVYALGLVLHECLTGRTPFSGGTVAEVTAQRLVADAPRPRHLRPDVPDGLDDVIAKATRLAPGRRYADGRALAAALAPHRPDDARRLLAELAGRVPADPDRTRPLTVRSPREQTTRIVPSAADGAEGTATPDEPHPRADPDRTRALPPLPPSGHAPRPADHDATSELAAAVTAPDPTPRSETARARPAGVEELGRTRSSSTTAAIAVGVVLILVAAIAAAVFAGGTAGDGRVAADDGADAEPAGPHAIVAAGDFDPHGDGEHPEDVPNAYDGDPGTVWRTQRYTNAAFGNLKPGVGIWFDLGEPVEVDHIRLLLATAGVDLEVHARDEPFQSGQLGEPVARISGADAEPAIDVDATAARYWLIWLTRIPGGRAEIAEIAFARP